MNWYKRKMVISEIHSLYNDENDLLRTVIKRIYEEWNPDRQQWHLKKIEYIFADPEFPIPSDSVEVSVETRHGWLIPPEWGIHYRDMGIYAEGCRYRAAQPHLRP